MRQFEDETFEFKPGFNLLVGENGCGKSTLLDAIHTALGPHHLTRKRPSFKDDDIRVGASELSIEIGTQGDGRRTYSKKIAGTAQRTSSSMNCLVLYYGSTEAATESLKSRKIPRISGSQKAKSGMDVGIEESIWKAEREEISRSNSSGEFGSSHQVRRFVLGVLRELSSSFRSFSWSFEPYHCKILPLNNEPQVLELAETIQKPLKHLVLRWLQENPSKLLSQLDQKIVRVGYDGFVEGHEESKGIVPGFRELLREHAPSTSIEYLRYCVAELRLTPRIMVQTGNGEMYLSQLSDGEQRIFSLLVDIGRMLLRHRNTLFRKSEALVLIDEIDVHLHPKWQRRIVGALESLFPHCQFIATTHSPFVIQAMPESRVRHLNRDLVGSFTDRGIEEITLKVLGIEDHQVSERYLEMLDTAKEYFRTLEQAKEESNSERLRGLRRKLRSLSHRYAENPAFQAYLEMHGDLTLGTEELL